jgi:NAD(P)-dependent dehydrogenase (short-subunit alcohol dehydrogenase family)
MAVWLITGSSRGLGRAIAEVVLEAGHRAVLTARNPQTVEDLVKRYPRQAIALPLDVRERTQAFWAVEKAIEQGYTPNVLVNNAGYGLVGALEELSAESIVRQVETNLLGVIWMCQAVIPHMRAQGGGFIFNVSSIAGYYGFKGVSLYNATKFGVTGLSEALAQELREWNIYVANIAPGPYRTDWAGVSLEKSQALATLDPQSPYYELNAAMAERYAAMDRQQPGDPAHVGRVLLDCVEKGWAPMHIILGDEARETWERYAPMRVFPMLQFIGHNKNEVKQPVDGMGRR